MLVKVLEDIWCPKCGGAVFLNETNHSVKCSKCNFEEIAKSPSTWKFALARSKSYELSEDGEVTKQTQPRTHITQKEDLVVTRDDRFFDYIKGHKNKTKTFLTGKVDKVEEDSKDLEVILQTNFLKTHYTKTITASVEGLLPQLGIFQSLEALKTLVDTEITRTLQAGQTPKELTGGKKEEL